jgi:hypothetical protein
MVHSPDTEAGAVSQDNEASRRVRTDIGQEESVEDGGGLPESRATEGRSLPVDRATMSMSNLPKGARHNAKHADGQSQREEWRSLVTEILEIGRHRKKQVRRVLVKTSVPGIFKVGVATPLSPKPLPSLVLTIDRSALGGV